MSTSVIARKGPKLGRNQVFLPNFTLTLLRTPNLPPTFASFIVPLKLNKLDLRDYLWHAYNIEVRAVRSYIQQQKLREGKPGAIRPMTGTRQWFRPRSIKRMTVEMVKPFVWPAEPEDFKAWDKENFEARRDQSREVYEGMQFDAPRRPSKDRLSIAEQAKALLKGEEEWTPTKDIWEDDGDAYEVEEDVEIPVEGKEKS